MATAPSASHPRTARCSWCHAFSLVEVMVGFAVFTIVCLGLSATAIHGLRLAHGNVMRTTAFATAQSYLEQIKVLPESDLREALANPALIPLPTRSITRGAVEEDDPLYLRDEDAVEGGGPNHKEILIDLRGDDHEREVFLDMWFDVAITSFEEAKGFVVTVDFEYEIRGLRALPRGSGTLQAVRSGEWTEAE